MKTLNEWLGEVKRNDWFTYRSGIPSVILDETAFNQMAELIRLQNEALEAIDKYLKHKITFGLFVEIQRNALSKTQEIINGEGDG